MTLWSWLKRLVKPGEAASARDRPTTARWVPASDSPFGIDLLDCRSFSQSILATTSDQRIAERFMSLRGSTGEEYRGCTPVAAVTFECTLRYPHQGATRDGPIFKAEAMEDKWDIYLYDGHLYFTRSWTGELVYRATIEFHENRADVVAVEARKELAEGDPAYPIPAVDYLIRSHLYRLPIPHPLPKHLGMDPGELALFSFNQYGRYGLFGAFGDTTRLRVPEQEQAGGADV